MNLEKCLSALISILFGMGQSLGCVQRNISCDDIKTANGYQFVHEAPEGSNIVVSDNETVIAVRTNQSCDHLPEVKHVDHHSVVTTHCRDLEVKCTFSAGVYAAETCVYFKAFANEEGIKKDQTKNPDPDPSAPRKPWGLVVGVCLMAAVGAGGVICYMRNKRRRQQGAASPQQGIFLAERGGTSETSSDRDPCHDFEDDTGQDSNLESVHVHEADGMTPQTLRLDRNVSNERIQLSKTEVRRVPDISRASSHRAMNSETDNGGAAGNHDAEDHETRRLLLANQRAASPGFDMTGDAIALVNDYGFDPDQVSGCSAAPETDVESTTNKNNKE